MTIRLRIAWRAGARSFAGLVGVGVLLGLSDVAFGATTKATDTLAAMCVAGGERDDVCACASAEFRRATDKNDVAVYSDVGRVYLARLKSAMPARDAWDDAIGSVAVKKRLMPIDLADKAGAIRARHEAAIHQCAEATAAIPTHSSAH